MFAITGGLEEFIILAGAGIVGAIVLGAARAVMGVMRKSQTRKRQAVTDLQTWSDFFFGVSPDPRNRTPGVEGWTQKVDRQLDTLTTGLREVLDQITPDHNGRHNLHGVVERTAEAVGVEIPPTEDPE